MIPAIVIMSSVAFGASAEEEQAEMIRVYDDMNNFRKKGAWDVVEKKYQKLLTYKKGQMTYLMHFIGAEAASSRGDVSTALERLQLALELEENQQGREWLQSMEQNFALVNLKVPSKLEPPPELEIAMMPFFPEQQQALNFAKAELASTGKFKGYIPLGEYTLGGSVFTVAVDQKMVSVTASAKDTAVAVNDTDSDNQTDPKNSVDPKEKKQNEKKEKEPKTPSDKAFNPRIDLGLSSALASAAAQGSDTFTSGGPIDSFSGMGTRMGVGVNIPVNERFGALVEVGYHGMRGAGVAPTAAELAGWGFGDVAGVISPYTASDTKYDGGFGWLAGSMAFNDVEVLIGPCIEFATAETQGMGAGELKYIPAQGTILASGVSTGLSYYGFSIGEGLKGGVSTLAGSQSDGSRWYTWGQVALTVQGK